MVILDPAGHKTTVPAQLHNVAAGLWRCEYTAQQLGLHSINVFYAGAAVPHSPFGVRVSPTSDARKVRCGGRGIQARGMRIGDDGDFQVYTDGAGDAVPAVQIIGPGGVQQPCTVKRSAAGKYQCNYAPQKPGKYLVMVQFGGAEVPKSPFEVHVGAARPSAIRAFGPGLHAGVVGHSSAFVVETNGETGALGFSVAGPSQAEIECKDNGDGSALVRYLPTAAGEYAVHILCDGEDIPHSPFIAHVLPKAEDFRPELVSASGVGVQPTGVVVGVPAEFTVDTRRAGDGPLELKVENRRGELVPVSVQRLAEQGLTRAVYTAEEAVAHTVEVNYGGVAVNESPYRVNVAAPLDVSRVRVYGPCVEHSVPVGAPTHFTVDARWVGLFGMRSFALLFSIRTIPVFVLTRSEAGDGDLNVNLVNTANGTRLACRLIDNGDGTYLVEVIPPLAGNYETQITYGDEAVPATPIVHVAAVVDVSQIKVDGLEESEYTAGGMGWKWWRVVS